MLAVFALFASVMPMARHKQQTITQLELKSHYDLSAKIAELQFQLNNEEAELLLKFKGGASVEGGPYKIEYNLRSGQRRPKWKEIVIAFIHKYNLLRELGCATVEIWEKKVIASTPEGNPSESFAVTKGNDDSV